MIDDTDQPYSEGWWLKTLLNELHDRRVGRIGNRMWTRDQVASSEARPPLWLLQEYLHGDPPLREDIHTGWAAPFRQYVRMGRLHVARLLVSATANRMGIRGFRTAAVADELGDQLARDIMRRNKLKLVARDVHNHMLGLGDGYTMVTPPDPKGPRKTSLITAESPLQCITAEDPATGETVAGLKAFRDHRAGIDWAYLFVKDQGLFVAGREGATLLSHKRGGFRFAQSWEWEPDKFDDVPGGRVPIVRFRNFDGIGEFEEHLDTLDRINDKLFNEWWIGKIQAFRQRAIQRKGDDDDDLDYDEATDTIVDPSDPERQRRISVSQLYVSSPDALWDLPIGATMWESTPVDVNPLVNSIQKELQWLAVASSKPIATLNPDSANQTAEGSSNQKEEHLYVVEDRRDRADGSWAETMSLAFEFDGDDTRSDVTQIETIWGPIERYSLAQKADAAQKANPKVPLPSEAVQRDIWQYDPAEIPGLRQMAGRDLIFQAPGQPAS